MSQASHTIRELAPGDTADFRALLAMFGKAFDEPAMYMDAQPGDAYLDDLLRGPHFIALIAARDDEVVGGLAAYVLPKFERERAEIYIYDLAVAAEHRRQGIATDLIEHLKGIAADYGAWVIFVQAEADDPPAVALYTKLGEREDAAHFDIKVPGKTPG